jgi:toxin ParE1/3/4
MNLRWTAKSLDDLEKIHDYIAQDNPEAATRTLAIIAAFIDGQLEEYPHSGRPGRVPGTRELVIRNTPFIAPYRVVGKTIQILRIYHAARRWPERF